MPTLWYNLLIKLMHSSTANKHINRTFGQMQRPTPLLKWDKYIVKIEMINVFMGAQLIQFANKLKSKSEPAVSN